MSMVITPPRAKIYQLLEQGTLAGQRFDCEMVYRALYTSGREVPLSTVQHALRAFESCGLLTHATAPGRRLYFELARPKSPESLHARRRLLDAHQAPLTS